MESVGALSASITVMHHAPRMTSGVCVMPYIITIHLELTNSVSPHTLDPEVTDFKDKNAWNNS